MTVSLPRFDAAAVLVAGDIMLDRYWYGATSRISPEAPVPVVHVRDVEERAGGAANVAVNVAALGGRPRLLGLAGADAGADGLSALLAGQGVEASLVRIPGARTIQKLRVVSRHQQLIRLDFEDGFGPEQSALMETEFEAALDGTRAVVLSDYAKGALARADRLIAMAREADVPVLVDPKGQDFARYRGATVITPNLLEFEAVVGACDDLEQVAERGEALARELDIEAVLVTRGEHGMSLLRPGGPPLHVPARAREVYDVTGAGDTVIAVFAAALAAGQTMDVSMHLANTAAGIVVGKLGTASAGVDELRFALREQTPHSHGVVSEDELLVLVNAARQQGESIVMTNGCFDILHVGHLTYLAEAKALGSRLVVAVNDDASVQRLKGRDRPVNTLVHRQAMLAGLAAVDWVVSFSEDTPARIIEAVAPDVLVKGGDNDPEQIPGGDFVRRNGGRVVVCGYVDGYSTTRLIDQVRGGP